MAEKEVAIKISVETEGGARSLSELKKEFKDTQKALEGLDTSSSKYVETLQKLGGIKDEIGDLNAEINAFNPEGKVQAFGNVIGGLASGFQAAQGAAALFGAEGEQLQKTLLKVQAASALADGIKGVIGMGDAFKVLGNIIKSNPLFLLASILIGIGTALFALKDKISFIGDAFDLITGTINKGIDALKSFTDWMGITSFAADDLAKKQIELAKKVGDATAKRYDTEIAYAKAAGKETIDLEIKKQAAFIASLKLQKKGIEEINAAQEELIVLTIQRNRKLQEENDKAAKERLDKNVKESKEFNKEWDDTFTAIANKGVEQEIRRTDAVKGIGFQEDSERIKRQQERTKHIEDFQKLNLQAEEQYINASQELSNSLFSVQLNNAKGNAKAEEEIRKRQFKVNKALSLSLATIDGIKAVQNGLATGGPVLAAVNGVLAAANIAKILSVKYQGETGGGEGGNTTGLNTASGGVAIAPPTSGSTQLNANGTVIQPSISKTPVVKAVVVETDVTSSQNRIKSIEEKAKL